MTAATPHTIRRLDQAALCIKRWTLSPPHLESGLALSLALTDRKGQKWYCMMSEVRLQEVLQLLLSVSWSKPTNGEAQLACWFPGEETRCQGRSSPLPQLPPVGVGPSRVIQAPPASHLTQTQQWAQPAQVEWRWDLSKVWIPKMWASKWCFFFSPQD